jgi:hypothetical protein
MPYGMSRRTNKLRLYVSCHMVDYISFLDVAAELLNKIFNMAYSQEELWKKSLDESNKPDCKFRKYIREAGNSVLGLAKRKGYREFMAQTARIQQDCIHGRTVDMYEEAVRIGVKHGIPEDKLRGALTKLRDNV